MYKIDGLKINGVKVGFLLKQNHPLILPRAWDSNDPLRLRRKLASGDVLEWNYARSRKDLTVVCH